MQADTVTPIRLVDFPEAQPVPAALDPSLPTLMALFGAANGEQLMAFALPGGRVLAWVSEVAHPDEMMRTLGASQSPLAAPLRSCGILLLTLDAETGEVEVEATPDVDPGLPALGTWGATLQRHHLPDSIRRDDVPGE